MMDYPTLPEVDEATHLQLARWYRFLKSPGASAIGGSQFAEIMTIESDVMRRIVYRLNLKGGMTPEISKEIGW